MSTFTSGNEAAAITAQMFSEQVYTYFSHSPPNRVLETNIWNQPVQVIHKDPSRDLLIQPAHSTSVLYSSPSLLSNIPFLYRLASCASPCVLHMVASADAPYSDFSQIMAVRDAGLPLICSSSVQEVHDIGAIAHLVSRAISKPVVHFYDGQRLAQESCLIQLVDKERLVQAVVNKDKKDVWSAFKDAAETWRNVTGRAYAPAEYVGHPEAACVFVAAGVGASMMESMLGHTMGVLKIRLYRPFPRQQCMDVMPRTVKRIVVLEPVQEKSSWNPLFLDIAAVFDTVDVVESGCYGMDELDFSPGHVAEGLLVGQDADSKGTQVIFVHHVDLATAFASRYACAQMYTIQGLSHVRVADQVGFRFASSLIQQADIVVLPAQHGESATLALNRLRTHGLVVLEQEMESVSAAVKALAYTKQARVVVVRDGMDILLCQEKLSHLSSSSVSVPESWSREEEEEATVVQSVQESEEQPYIKILKQVFGDRLNIANAYGARSIWSYDHSDATPEFGYGRLVHLAQDRTRLVDHVMEAIKASLLPADVTLALSQWLIRFNSKRPDIQKIHEAAERVAGLLLSSSCDAADTILKQKELLYMSSDWLIGSDGWAYDLGASGLHHVISSGDNINMLIIDTARYSQPVDREKRKKDIGLYAMNFGSVYVASVAMYASYTGVLNAMMEAEAFPGPSLVLAYLPDSPDPLSCLQETKVCVDNGSWPLYRWHPLLEDRFQLDSQKIKRELENFLKRENQLTQLTKMCPDISEMISSSLESDVKKRHDELKAKARADYARLLSGLEGAQDGPPLTVLFGSDNGNAEGLAKKVAIRAKSRGCQVKLMAMDDYGDIQELGDEKNVLMICSTAGQGELPSNAREFWKAFNNLLVGDVNLADVNYAVFGLGDSHYWPREEDAVFYNRPGKLLDAKFENLGASRLVPLGLGDDQDDDGFETGFNAWIPEFWKSINLRDVDENFQEPVYTDDQMKLDSNYLRGNIAQELSDYSTGSVTETTGKLLKFHGIYLQDDRDLRDERKKEGSEKAYSFLIRVRTPGGIATPKQWLTMDTLSERYANKTLKLTTRQAFQLHGVLKKNLRTTVRNINKTLLSTLAACGDVNRNIMCTSITEIPEVHEQVQKLVIEMKDLLAPQTSAYHEIWLDNSMVAGHAVQDFEPIYGPSYLPRKFKIVIAVPPSNDVDVYAHDLGFIAIVDPTSKTVSGYNVLIGGGMGQTHGNKKTYPRPASLIGYVAADKVLEVTKAVVLTQRDHGDRVNRKHARFKYTIDDLGLEFIKNEIETRSGVKFEEAKTFTFKDNIDQYGWSKGIEDTWNFTMFIENGRVRDTPEFHCKTGLRELARFHKGEFRLTSNQHLVIANIPQQDLEKTKAHLAKYKLDNMSFTGIRKASMACVALPTCGLAMAESERYLPRLITLLEKSIEEAGISNDTIVIRMTGCPNGCARPYLAELAFVGKAPETYNVYLGGNPKGERLNKLYKENMNENDILKELSPMIKQYALERSEEESFGDWVIRVGHVKRTIDGKDFHDI